jgi:epoxyqueuosine reductase
MNPAELDALIRRIRIWALQLGFQQLGVADVDLSAAEERLREWLQAGYGADMHWMALHGSRRSRPAELVPGTVRVISVRMDYLPPESKNWGSRESARDRACISRYALGRDYHKVLRNRLQSLAARIATEIGPFGHRVFTDSAPVMEKPLAEKAGLGWIGKHTNLISPTAGSWFFLGDIYTDLPLPIDRPATDHCGSCRACIDVCPTRAIVAPYVLDARRCISYLTIENRGPIPEDLRAPIGNRIFGCDDCQLVCPWNKFAQPTAESDFLPRNGLESASLSSLFEWEEPTWDYRTRGTPLRRAGFEGWRRNLAVALGNAPTSAATIAALERGREDSSSLVREHVAWALRRHQKSATAGETSATRSDANGNIVD